MSELTLDLLSDLTPVDSNPYKPEPGPPCGVGVVIRAGESRLCIGRRGHQPAVHLVMYDGQLYTFTR
jgi:hypothetical protein